jgi:DNA polymerase-3 subunit epsilon
VVDTVRLARRLVGGRCSLAALAFRFGCRSEPCHRALPDAKATAEVLLRLLGLAQERGAETVSDLVELSAPRARRLAAKRSLAAGAPARPGVYLFRDAVDNVLYVGRARDLRARLRSYFATERQRPAVEAALGALDRIEWRVLGSELEAALEELRLIRELRPPANAQGKRAGVYLRRRGDDWVCSEKPGPFGPIRSRRLAREAARALSGLGVDDPADGVPLVRARLARLAAQLRFEDAARRRDRLAALEKCVAAIAGQRRLRALEACVLAPAAEEGLVRAFFVRGGRVAATRTWLEGPAAAIEVDAGLAEAFRVAPSEAPEHADELAVVAQFLRRPPPELRIVPLRREAILRARPHRPERAVA